MHAMTLSLHAPSTLGVKSKGIVIFLLKVVKLHFKLKGMKPTIICKKIFCPYTQTLAPRVGFKGQNSFPSESSHVAYQMNRKVGYPQTMVIYSISGLGERGS